MKSGEVSFLLSCFKEPFGIPFITRLVVLRNNGPEWSSFSSMLPPFLRDPTSPGNRRLDGFNLR